MGLSSKIQVSCQIHMMRSGTRAAAKSTALAQLQTRTRLVRSARNLAKVVVVVIRHRGDPAGELLCEFRVYPLLPQVPDAVDDREIDRLAFAPSSTLR